MCVCVIRDSKYTHTDWRENSGKLETQTQWRGFAMIEGLINFGKAGNLISTQAGTNPGIFLKEKSEKDTAISN